MKVIEVEQNSPEWEAAKSGKFSASNMHKIISPTGKVSKQVDSYIDELIAERITGELCNSFKGNAHTERGHEMEDEAANYYAMLYGVEPQKVGFCLTDDEMIGASPDRLIGDDGMLEIKTCIPRIMVEMYQDENLEQEHRPQTQCGLFVTGRKWIDTMLYCPKMKPVIIRSTPIAPFIMDMVRLTKEAHQTLLTRMQGIAERGYIDTDPGKYLRAG